MGEGQPFSVALSWMNVWLCHLHPSLYPTELNKTAKPRMQTTDPDVAAKGCFQNPAASFNPVVEVGVGLPALPHLGY